MPRKPIRKPPPAFVIVAQEAVSQCLESDLSTWTPKEQQRVLLASLNANPRGRWNRWAAWEAALDEGQRILQERQRLGL